MLTHLRKIIILSNFGLAAFCGFVFLFMVMTTVELVSITFLAILMKEISAGNLFISVPSYVSDFINLDKELNITTTAALLLMIFLSKAIFESFCNFLIVKKTAAVQYSMKMKIFSIIGQRSFKKNTESLSEKIISSQILTAQFQSVLQLLLRGAGDCIFSIAVIMYLILNVNTKTLIFILTISCVIFTIVKFLNRVAQKSGRFANHSNIESTTILESYVRGFKEIFVFNGQYYFYNLLKQRSKQFQSAIVKKQFIQTLPKIYIELFFIGFLFVLVLDLENNIALDHNKNFMLILVIVVRLIPLLRNLINLSQQINYSKDSIDRLHDILRSDIDDFADRSFTVKNLNTSNDNKQFFSILKGINISKTYDEREVLSKFNFEVKRGEVVGIIGPSGAGKTTLIDIISGFAELDSGAIFLNGKEVVSSYERSLDPIIGYVSQEPVVFQGSILENITFGKELNPTITKKLIEILDKLGLSRLFGNAEACLKFMVTEMGGNLSGGMKQRVAIARALYFGRDLVILDEPTSSLDTESSSSLFEVIKTLSDTTFIIVTHDRSFDAMFDKVFQLGCE